MIYRIYVVILVLLLCWRKFIGIWMIREVSLERLKEIVVLVEEGSKVKVLRLE